jgi:hypothetical protein
MTSFIKIYTLPKQIHRFNRISIKTTASFWNRKAGYKTEEGRTVKVWRKMTRLDVDKAFSIWENCYKIIIIKKICFGLGMNRYNIRKDGEKKDRSTPT